MLEALRALADEDPTFQFRGDENTGQMIISGMGELHLEIIVERLLREFKVQARVGKPQVAYRETVTQTAQAEDECTLPRAGKPQYARVVLELSAGARGSGVVFVNEASPLEVPPAFLPAVRAAVEEAARPASWQVTRSSMCASRSRADV